MARLALSLRATLLLVALVGCGEESTKRLGAATQTVTNGSADDGSGSSAPPQQTNPATLSPEQLAAVRAAQALQAARNPPVQNPIDRGFPPNTDGSAGSGSAGSGAP